MFDFGRQDEVAHAVMDLLEGETLCEKLDAGPIPQAEMGSVLKAGCSDCPDGLPGRRDDANGSFEGAGNGV